MSTSRVSISGDHLTIEPRGLDKLWSLRSRLRVPLANVKGATHDPGMRHEPKGWRGPGLRLPGKLAGTFHADGERQFWNVSGFERTVVIELGPGERFSRLIVSVDDPRATVATINKAVHSA